MAAWAAKVVPTGSSSTTALWTRGVFLSEEVPDETWHLDPRALT